MATKDDVKNAARKNGGRYNPIDRRPPDDRYGIYRVGPWYKAKCSTCGKDLGEVIINHHIGCNCSGGFLATHNTEPIEICASCPNFDHKFCFYEECPSDQIINRESV